MASIKYSVLIDNRKSAVVLRVLQDKMKNGKGMNLLQLIFDKMSTALFIFGINRSLHLLELSNRTKLAYYTYSLVCVTMILYFLISNWPALNGNKPFNWTVMTLKYIVAAIFGVLKNNDHFNRSYFRAIEIRSYVKENKYFIKYIIFLTVFLTLELINLVTSLNYELTKKELHTYTLWLLILLVNVDCIWTYSVFYIMSCKLYDVYRRLKVSRSKISDDGDTCKRPFFILTSKYITTNKKQYVLNNFFCEYRCVVRAIKASVWTIKPTFIFYLVTVLLFTCSNIINGIIEMGDNIKLAFTLSTVLLFTNIRFKSLFLVWIICFQGEALKDTDLKIKTLLTEISLEIDDFDPEKRVANKFLRYLEKNRNKLRMWRIINIELRLSWLCFMKLFDFTLLVIQVSQIF